MTIKRNHIPYYEEILALPGLLKDPALIFGFQEIRIPKWAFSVEDQTGFWRRYRNTLRNVQRLTDWVRSGGVGSLKCSPDSYRSADLSSLLRVRGLQRVECLDLFDHRADLRWDMNEPIPDGAANRYSLAIDIGSLEHVFDTRVCLENMMRLIRPGGFYVLHTPINGFFAHGFHVFNPEMLSQTLELNGFAVRYRRFSAPNGRLKTRDIARGDTIIWIVAERIRQQETFICPQQGFWRPLYAESALSKRTRIQEDYWKSIEEIH